MSKPKVVAFAGPGASSDANTKKLLNDFFPEDEEIGELYVPDKILRGQSGLKSVVAWLNEEVTEDLYTKVPKIALVSKLKSAAGKDGDPYLVFLPPADGELDSKDEELIREAIDNGIPVKDLTEGLDDVLLDEEDTSDAPEEPAEPVSRKRRGKSRNTERSAAQEEPDEAQVEAEKFVPNVDAPAKDCLTKSWGTGTTGFLEESIYQYVKDKLIADGLVKEPKAKVYPSYADKDGNYRPILGRGRPRKGEERVELTEAEAAKIPGLLEEFAAAE